MFVLSHAYTCAIPGASFPTYPPSHHRTAIPQSAPLNMLVLSYVYTRVTSGAHLFLRILPRTIVRQSPQSAPLNMFVLSYVYTHAIPGAHLFPRIPLRPPSYGGTPNPAHLTCSYSRAVSGARIPPWPSFRALARAYTPITPPAVPNTPRTHIRASRPGAALSPTYPLFTVTRCDSNVSRPARTFLHFVIAFASWVYAIINAPYLMHAYIRAPQSGIHASSSTPPYSTYPQSIPLNARILSRTHIRASRPGAALSPRIPLFALMLRCPRLPAQRTFARLYTDLRILVS